MTSSQLLRSKTQSSRSRYAQRSPPSLGRGHAVSSAVNHRRRSALALLVMLFQCTNGAQPRRIAAAESVINQSHRRLGGQKRKLDEATDPAFKRYRTADPADTCTNILGKKRSLDYMNWHSENSPGTTIPHQMRKKAREQKIGPWYRTVHRNGGPVQEASCDLSISFGFHILRHGKRVKGVGMQTFKYVGPHEEISTTIEYFFSRMKVLDQAKHVKKNKHDKIPTYSITIDDVMDGIEWCPEQNSNCQNADAAERFREAVKQRKSWEEFFRNTDNCDPTDVGAVFINYVYHVPVDDAEMAELGNDFKDVTVDKTDVLSSRFGEIEALFRGASKFPRPRPRSKNSRRKEVSPETEAMIRDYMKEFGTEASR